MTAEKFTLYINALRTLLINNALKVGGTYNLAAGGTSNYYLDARMVTMCHAGASMIGQLFHHKNRKFPVRAVGGMEVGALPVVMAAMLAAPEAGGRFMEGFWVRKSAKKYGTKKNIEGDLKPGTQVAIVDDVFTRGESAAAAVRAVRAAGSEVSVVWGLIDRNVGAAALFKELGVPFHTLYQVEENSDHSFVQLKINPDLVI